MLAGRGRPQASHLGQCKPGRAVGCVSGRFPSRQGYFLFRKYNQDAPIKKNLHDDDADVDEDPCSSEWYIVSLIFSRPFSVFAFAFFTEVALVLIRDLFPVSSLVFLLSSSSLFSSTNVNIPVSMSLMSGARWAFFVFVKQSTGFLSCGIHFMDPCICFRLSSMIGHSSAVNLSAVPSSFLRASYSPLESEISMPSGSRKAL